MEEKWNSSTEILDEYERRFAKARADKKLLRPWQAEDRDKIISSVKRMIRYNEALVPKIIGIL